MSMEHARAGAPTSTEADEGEVLARDASADVRAFYLQAAFRALLDAMARPGELAQLPEAPQGVAAEAARAGIDASSLMLADVLLDAATSFSVAGARADELERAVAGRTHAAVRHTEDAAFTFVGADVRGDEAKQAVLAAPAGTLVAPHLGATLIVVAGTLLGLDERGSRTGSSSGADRQGTYVLSGPGVDGTATLTLDRTDVMRARAERADEFPCGIDLVFVDGAGHVAAVPRSTTVEAADAAAGTQAFDTEGGTAWAM